MAKLESFIEQYIKNQKIADYESWVAAYGTDSKGAYAEAKKEADTLYERSRADFGENASSLYARGLSGSGYSDYLNAAAYAERSRANSDAIAKKHKSEEENRKGYLSYVMEESERIAAQTTEEEKKIASIFSDLLSREISDKSAAVTYLTTRGVDEETADMLADQSIRIYRGSDAYRTQVIDGGIAQKYYYPEAYQYALLQGISPAMADEIAKIINFAVASGHTNGAFYYKE